MVMSISLGFKAFQHCGWFCVQDGANNAGICAKTVSKINAQLRQICADKSKFLPSAISHRPNVSDRVLFCNSVVSSMFQCKQMR